MRAAYLLVVFHLGAAVRFATTSWFTTTSVCNTAAGFAATRIATSITTRVVTMSKAKALGAEAERKNDRPENDVPFHRFRLLIVILLTVRERPIFLISNSDNPRVKRCIPYRVTHRSDYRKIFEVQLARIVRFHPHVKNMPFSPSVRPGPAGNTDQS